MRFAIPIGITLLACLISSFNLLAQAEVPQAFLKFDEEKIFIINNEKVVIEADVYLGTADQPVTNIYALSFDIGFPANMVIADSTAFIYNPQSFLGTSSQVSILQKPIRQLDKGRLDVTIGRKDGKNVSGFGKIGTIHLITVSDIIGSLVGDDSQIILNLDILRIEAQDVEDHEIPIEANEEGSEVTLILDRLASDLRLNNRRVDVYPIPANDMLYISLYNLRGEQVEVFNAFGQRVHIEPIRTNYLQLSTNNYQPGIYFLKVHAEEGIMTRRILIGR